MTQYYFHSVVDDGSVTGLKEHFGVPNLDIDCGKPTCYIDWELQPEARSWGIKSISVFATQIKATIEWEVSDEMTEEEKTKLIAVGGIERNETISGLIEIDTKEKHKGKEWEIDSNLFINDDGQCLISDCEIDFENMIIIVS